MNYPGNVEITAWIKKGFQGTTDPPTMADFRVWEQVFGVSVSKLAGKDHARKTHTAITLYRDPSHLQQKSLSIDILYRKRKTYLIGVLKPATYFMGEEIQSRAQKSKGRALLNMVLDLRAKRFSFPIVTGDNEFSDCKSFLAALGIDFQPTPALQHDVISENGIKLVKNGCRSAENRVMKMWADPKDPTKEVPLPLSMEEPLVKNAMSQINMRLITNGKLRTTTAREIVLGRPYSPKLDGVLPFGTPVAYRNAESDNTHTPRILEGIILGSLGKVTGGSSIWNPQTGQEISRQAFTEIPLSPQLRQAIILRGNEERRLYERSRQFSKNDDDDAGTSDDDSDEEQGKPAPTYEQQKIARESRLANRSREPELILMEGANNSRTMLSEKDTILQEALLAGLPALHDLPEERSTTSTPSPFLELSAELEKNIKERRAARTKMMASGNSLLTLVNSIVDEDIVISEDNMMVDIVGAVMSLKRAKEVMGTERAIAAAMKEVTQWIKTGVGRPIKKENLTKRQRACILNAMMKCSDKTDVEGEHIEDKGRLVVDGSTQAQDSYNTDRGTLYSANVSSTSLNLTMTIGAHREMDQCTFDVKGAFTKGGKFPGSTVVARISKEVTEMFCAIDESLREFVGEDGCLYLILEKSIYGLVEAAKMWNEEIVEQLKKLGFQQNPYDPGLFFGIFADHFMIINLHVDDMRVEADKGITGSLGACTQLFESLEKIYGKGEIKFKYGKKLEFLGCWIDKSVPGETRVTQPGLIKEILATGWEGPVMGYSKYPAEKHLFSVDEGSPALNETEGKQFLSMVMKLSFLAQRSRPDLLTATASLTTKASKPTEQDKERLLHLLRYLNGSKEKGLCLRPGKSLDIKLYVDASFAEEPKRVSRTGFYMTMGESALIIARSVKQKLVTRSTMESEIVAIDDSSSVVMLVENTATIMGIPLGPVIIYEDNQSTITAIKNGTTSAERTRHIDVKYFWLHDKIKSGKMILRYIKSEENIADYFTKSICTPGLFSKFVKQILNWD